MPVYADAMLPWLPCATLERLPHAPPLAPVAVAATAGVKGVRDPYELPNEATSDNFAVHWGSTGNVDAGDADVLLAAFEQAWAVQVEDMAHPAPLTTASWKFNVYVADTGDGAPGSYGAGGYYWVDGDGYPMVVISRWALADASVAASTAHHEFYHAVQGSLARFTYQDPGAWFWEATAEWAAIETDPDSEATGTFAFGYLLLPHYSANFFDYPDTGTLQEYHQYGAFLLPHDLTRQHGWELVRDTWTDPGSEPDPLEVMRGWLAERDADLDALWLDHLAHNAVYDYDAGDRYRDVVEAYEPYFPEASVVVADVRGDGGEGEVEGDLAPRRYGGNTIELKAPWEGTLVVAIEGDRKGSEDSSALWGARVVREWHDGTLEYHEVPFDGRNGALEVERVGEEASIWLAVGAWTEAWSGPGWHDETFAYRWSMTVVEPEPETTSASVASTGSAEPARACGCGHGSPGVGLWVAAAWLRGRAGRRPARSPAPRSRPGSASRTA